MTLLYGDAGARALGDEPAIRAVDEIFDSAIRARASDIHIEPWSDGGRVRERVDGVLRESKRISARLLPRMLSRIKLLAGMDIADRRLPQDGRYALDRPGGGYEARVSSVPTIAGEKVVVRLLNAHALVPSLEGLGMGVECAAPFRQAVHGGAGFVVVCGPTGSGKTTTLYAAIAERNVAGQQICSIEDPIEVLLPGTAQVQVNVRAGLTFAVGLRAFLRQDPNVIAIGEMRDAETASVAASAALCGQLVLTTLHSGDALSAFERLRELGMSSRRIGAAVTAIAAQRLLRRLCTACKQPAIAGARAVRFGIAAGTRVCAPGGCAACAGSGYSGRIGVFEVAVMSAELRYAVETDAPPETVRRAALRAGYRPMTDAVAGLVVDGTSSLEETARVLNAECA